MKDKQLLALVKKAVKNDGRAFEELCNQKAREVIYLCISEMRNVHDGEDAAQEVFIRMQKNIHRLKAPEAFNVWLNRLVHTTCLNMKRDSMKHKDALQTELTEDSVWQQEENSFMLPQEFMEDAEKRRMLADMVNSLPDKYRQCILLHYYQSLSYTQIAQVLGISTDAVNNNMRMARKHLKLELEAAQQQHAPAGGVWAAVPLAAAGPLLSASLQEAATVMVPQSLLTHCLASAGVGAGAAAGSGASAAAGTTTVVKGIAAAGIAAALLVGAGGGVALYNIRDADPAMPAGTQTETGPRAADDAAAADYTSLITGTVRLQPGAEVENGARTGLGEVALALVDADDPSSVRAVVLTQSGGQQGRFMLEDIPDGEYSLQVILPSHATGLDTNGVLVDADGFVSVAGDTVLYISGQDSARYTDLEILLDIPSEINGYISLRQEDSELAYTDYGVEVQVSLLDPQGVEIASTIAGPDGSYRFENPMITQTGTYTLRIEVEDLNLNQSLQVEEMQIDLYPGYRD